MADSAEARRADLIAGARKVLDRDGDGALESALAGDLFGRVSLEDLAAADADRIAVFVRSAATILRSRRPGHALVRIADSGPVTLVEILNDNMPFLVDSVLGEVQDFGGAILLVAHPVVTVRRDGRGRLVDYLGFDPAPPPAIRESLMQIHLARLPSPAARLALKERIESLLEEIRRAVSDWRPMLARLEAAIAAYRSGALPIPEDETAEAVAFLEWLGDDNFTFLGARDYDFIGSRASGELRRAASPGLGILSDPDKRILRRGSEAITSTPMVRDFLMRPEPLIISKADLRSRIHRRAAMDYVGIKLYGRGGRISGELRLIGLFTSTAYTASVREIPYLRRKVANILVQAGFDPAGHSGKALATVLEFYPRDDLFQIDEETLFAFVMAILALEERPRVRVLARRDKFDRFISVLAYVPRDRYDSTARRRIGDYLAKAFDAHVSAAYPAFLESPLARVHFILGRSGSTSSPDPDQASLEAAVADIVRSWSDGLDRALAAHRDAAAAAALGARYAAAFPVAYRDVASPEEAVGDIETFERLTAEHPIAGGFRIAADGGIRLKLAHRGAPIPLSTRVPMLENMGFRVIDEQTYEVTPAEAAILHVHDMSIAPADGTAVDIARLAPLLVDGFMAVWSERADNDGYNALIAIAGLGWRDVALLRTVSRFLHQAGTPYPQSYMWTTLGRHPAVAAALVAFFHARFAPGSADAKAAAGHKARIETMLDAVQSLDEDRILRRFLGVIDAAVRTNFFQVAADGRPHDEITIKLDSLRIEGLPAPRPFREIFIHGPRVEGVHLRFGRVARGGIRWSDRPQDFRTEVLGLVKAQQVKNAVIVPVGAKGGFIPRRLPSGDRSAILAEGTAAYRRFIAALLDLTDNLDGDRVIPPNGVVRQEGDDPYLVVAADKGTATFSDTANAIAIEHGFWLGDAFASGGSAGYDHKKMGITARGAWEAVKRHFREMDVDIQTSPFTVVGVGDMSGDVFGNAMLLSPATRLVAAFDHRDIFLDPSPDPATSLAERQRLFALPRSSWQDYDRAILSVGGGVFSRQEKAIPLSAEARALLHLKADKASPAEVIRAILKARVDLLFFGGIGTFVRAEGESDDRVGDRANDALRITGREIRARVVGEGANLGMTQRGRIEYGLAGGRCNSDAIDNSAGVNTSDVEVNIKIALGRAVRDGRLDLKRRNRLLQAMTGEVAALVLRNNYLQTLAISLAERRGFEDFGHQQRLMQSLEGRGLLDRAVESLPDDLALAERQKEGKPLTRSEIGVLLAYAKITLFDDLLGAGVSADATLDEELVGYFPEKMQTAWRDDIETHRLRAEIIATRVGNSMINRGGPTYLVRIADRTGAAAIDVARAYVAVRDSYGLRDLNGAIDRLDNRVSGGVQLDLYRSVQDLLLDETIWFLRNADFTGGIGPVVSAFGASITAIEGMLGRLMPEVLAARAAARARDLEAAGVPQTLALRLARLPVLSDATDIQLVAKASGATLERAAAEFFAVGEEFRIDRIEELAARLPGADYFDGLARDRALETLGAAQRQIAEAALKAGGLAAWRSHRGDAVARTRDMVVVMTESGELSVSRLTVAASLVADLARP